MPLTICGIILGIILFIFGMKARVKNVRNHKKTAVWIIVATVFAAGIMAFCFLTDRLAAWKNQWCSVYVSDKVYFDPVRSSGKASKQTPFQLILDDENHMLIRRTQEDGEDGVYVRDLGQADIGGEYLGGTDLWAIAREYAPAQYRNSEPQKSPGVLVRQGLNEDYSYHVLFRPKGNVFFYAIFDHSQGREPELQSLCRMKRTGPWEQEYETPRWYVTVPVKGVRYINVRGDFGNHITYCGHWNRERDAVAFDVGERVFLNGLDGIEDISQLSVVAYANDHTPVYSFFVSESSTASYADENGWQLANAKVELADGASDSTVITAFLRMWFTSDAEGRYTRLHRKWPSGEQLADEQAIADYFNDVLNYVTDEFYQKMVMNRGYHSYDHFAAERGLSVSVRGVRIETADDGNYTFTVHLKNGNRGIDDYASGNLRIRDGKIDGMHVSEMTLGQDWPDSETPTSDFREEEYSGYNGERTTAVPPEETTAAPPETDSEPAGRSLTETTSPYEKAGTAVEVSPVNLGLIDFLHITPELLEQAERDVQLIEKTVSSEGIHITVEQALTYPDVCGIVVTVSFEGKVLKGHHADELYPYAYLLTPQCDTEIFGDRTCDIITQGENTVVYFIRLFSGGAGSFTTETELTLEIASFSNLHEDATCFTIKPKKSLLVHFPLTHIGEAKPINVPASSQSKTALTGVAILSPLSLTVDLTGSTQTNRKAAGNTEQTELSGDVRLTLDHGIPAAQCIPVKCTERPLVRQFALSSFINPDAVRYLIIGEQKINCQN